MSHDVHVAPQLLRDACQLHGLLEPGLAACPLCAELSGRQPPLEPPMAIVVSPADLTHMDAMLHRSYQLALARGHVRR